MNSQLRPRLYKCTMEALRSRRYGRRTDVGRKTLCSADWTRETEAASQPGERQQQRRGDRDPVTWPSLSPIVLDLIASFGVSK